MFCVRKKTRWQNFHLFNPQQLDFILLKYLKMRTCDKKKANQSYIMHFTLCNNWLPLGHNIQIWCGSMFYIESHRKIHRSTVQDNVPYFKTINRIIHSLNHLDCLKTFRPYSSHLSQCNYKRPINFEISVYRALSLFRSILRHL